MLGDIHLSTANRRDTLATILCLGPTMFLLEINTDPTSVTREVLQKHTLSPTNMAPHRGSPTGAMLV